MNKTLKTVLLVGVFSILVFLETSLPYYFAEKNVPNGKVFLGQIKFAYDQNMYFSFIRQAKEGKFLLNNKYSNIHNGDVFFNLQFWFIGYLQRLTGASENAVYTFWRYLGALILTLGFVLLADKVIPSFKRKKVALFVFLFAGGFRFIVVILNHLGFMNNQLRETITLDNYAGKIPFMQIMANPNHAIPNGLLLMGYAMFLFAEQTGKLIHYILSGIILAFVCSMRNYDILPMFILFPIYIFVSGGFNKGNIKLIIYKLLPVLFVLPVMLYSFWLFKINESFKCWSAQGFYLDKIPSIWKHYLNFGLVGLLAIFRVAQIQKHPFSKPEKFLGILFIVTFLFTRGGTLTPLLGWSMQIGLYLTAPLALIGFNLNLENIKKNRIKYLSAIFGLFIFTVVTNLNMMQWQLKFLKSTLNTNDLYCSKSEFEAWHWIEKNMKLDDVVLATAFTSTRLSKYTNVSLVVGHPSLTPDFLNKYYRIKSAFEDTFFSIRQKPLLDSLHAGYFYVGPLEQRFNPIIVDTIGGYFREIYHNKEVSIFKIRK